MEEKRVQIILGADGSVRVEAFGFNGTSCQEATQFINDLFGSPKSIEFKDSYYETDLIAEGLPEGHCG